MKIDSLSVYLFLSLSSQFKLWVSAIQHSNCLIMLATPPSPYLVTRRRRLDSFFPSSQAFPLNFHFATARPDQSQVIADETYCVAITHKYKFCTC